MNVRGAILFFRTSAAAWVLLGAAAIGASANESTTEVIVQARSVGDAERIVQQIGGTVTDHLAIIEAVTAELTAVRFGRSRRRSVGARLLRFARQPVLLARGSRRIGQGEGSAIARSAIRSPTIPRSSEPIDSTKTASPERVSPLPWSIPASLP
jgi:hypothetical protein